MEGLIRMCRFLGWSGALVPAYASYIHRALSLILSHSIVNETSKDQNHQKVWVFLFFSFSTNQLFSFTLCRHDISIICLCRGLCCIHASHKNSAWHAEFLCYACNATGAPHKHCCQRQKYCLMSPKKCEFAQWDEYDEVLHHIIC